MKKIFSLFVLLVSFYLGNAQRVAPAAYSSTAPFNYIRTWDAKAPQTDASKILATASTDSFTMTTVYLDGLGRPIQTVVKAMTPSGKDLVTPVVYDEFGREQYKYLPFAANTAGGNSSTTDGLFKLNPFQQDSAFYQSSNTVSPIKGQGETYFYSQTVFEASPLNRITNAFAPGNSWVGNSKGIGQQYLINTVSDSVRIWNAGTNPSDFPTSSLRYNAGELYKNISTDENGKQVVEYKDKEGKVVLKKVQLSASPGTAHVGWLCTYYVYDDLGNLRFVLQPKAVEMLLLNGNWTITSTIRDELCFYYGYDARLRMTTKKVPGAGEVWMIYDGRDRMVLSQDSNLRAQHNWLFTKYDALNRAIMTGLYNDATHTSLSGMQSYLDTQNMALAEDDSTSFPMYTISHTFPVVSSSDILTITYYDNYRWVTEYQGMPATKSTMFDTDLSAGYPSSGVFPFPEAMTQSNLTRGLVTGEWANAGIGVVKANYYDEKGRVIQVYKKAFNGGPEYTSMQYSFSGQLLQTYFFNGHSLVTRYTLDKALRISKIEHKASLADATLNLPASWTTTSQMQYDEIGQLKKKILGNALDSMEYDYNIRGWELGANRDYAKSTSLTSHYFGFDLGYDKRSLGSIGSYADSALNGNIIGTVWKSKGDGEIRKYDFAYDAVNRLTSATFKQYTGGSFNTNAGFDFSVSNLTYDANGNILSQKQNGWKLNNSITIDSLAYNYISGGNRLLNVIDGTNDAQTKLGDFRTSTLHPNSGSKNSSTVDYTYDGNGNLLKDYNKDLVNYSGADGIEYNYLNLPVRITFKKDASNNKGVIEYLYEPTGLKCMKTVYEPGVDTTYYIYSGPAVYKTVNPYSVDLLSLEFEDGKIRFEKANPNNCPATSDRFIYDYYVKDHLGNVRMVLTEQNESMCYPAATVEDASYTDEQKLYDIVNGRRIDKTTTGATQSSFGSKLYRVHGGLTNEKVGLGIVLKVMAGDQVKINCESYYTMPGGGPGTPTGGAALSELLSAFVGGTAVSTTHAGITTSDVSGIGSNSTSIPSFISGNSEGSNNARAFVNYILFDEQMRFVSGGADPVNVGGGYKSHTAFVNAPVSVAKNGYIYVYVSNESNLPVYFDNLAVTHTPGKILEETHYYPFGLAMKGISSQSLSTINLNRLKYNGKEEQRKEFSDGSGLEWLDYGARMYDNQIGRFMTIDPSSEKYLPWTPYNYVGNNPTLIVDPDGKDWVVTTEKDRKGNIVYKITVNAVLYNNSSSSKIDMDQLSAAIKKQVLEVFNFKGKGFSVQTTFNLRTVNSVQDIKETDHVFQVVDQKELSPADAIADAETGGLNIRIGADYVNSIIDGGNTRSVAHELGHTAGWGPLHPDEIKNPGPLDPKPEEWKSNLMITTYKAWELNGMASNAGNIARTITGGQMQQLANNYAAGQVNQNSPVYSEWGLHFLRIPPSFVPIPMITKDKKLRK